MRRYHPRPLPGPSIARGPSAVTTIYALLIGIDDYPLPVPRLRGCVNDIREMQTYLQARVDPGGRPVEEALRVKTLINHEATRSAVIGAFRGHLGQAGADDVAFFCY